MGDLKYGLANPYQINVANPAALSSLRTPTFSAGTFLNRVNTSTESISQTNTNAFLNYIALAFPFGGRFSAGAGILPYTQIGYSIVESSQHPDLGTVDERYFGEGGINIAYANFSYALIKDSLNFLALGVKPGYYFGTTNRSSRILFSNANAYNTIREDRLLISDVHATFGVNYKRQLSARNAATQKLISLGGVYEHGAAMSADREQTVFSSSPTGFPKDTVTNINESGTITWPGRFGFGVVFEFANDTIGRWDIGFDYSQTMWSNFERFDDGANLNDSRQFSVGAQYIPDENAYRSLFKLMQYRVGAYFRETRLNINNQGVNDLGISVGVGIPLIGSGTADPTSSKVNISATYGQRGEATNTLISERYLNILVGFTFTPGKYDFWFKKRKIE